MASKRSTKSQFSTYLMASAVSLICLTSAVNADTLPLKEVSISNAGLLHMTHKGDVSGKRTFELSAQASHIDDILKSLVILDPSGSINSVSLPGKAPLSQKFEGLPFSPNATNSLINLLNSLKGHEIEVENQGAEARGKLVTAEVEHQSDKNSDYSKPAYKLSLMGEDGLSVITIYDLAQIRIPNKALRSDFEKALSALKETNEKGSKTIKIVLDGTKSREVSYSYVIPAPLWKSAYRMVLPDFNSNDKTGVLQGWAILENMSGQDWSDVKLSLTSGSPVTYKQNLYESYYRARPTLPIQTVGALNPHKDEGTIEEMSFMDAAPKMRKASMMGSRMAASADFARNELAAAPPMPETMSMSNGLAQMKQAVQTNQTVASQTITLGSTISLPHSHSMMAPVINDNLPMEAVSFYKSGTGDKNPYASVLLNNKSDVSLPAGIITLYSNDTYLGDAEMPNLPKGEERMVPYALDTDVTIAEQTGYERNESSLVAARGVIKIKVKQIQKYNYVIDSSAMEKRVVVIDIPKRGNWDISKEDRNDVNFAYEETPNFHRLRVKLDADKARKFDVKFEYDSWDSISIASLSRDRLAQIAASNPDRETAQFLKDLAAEYANIDIVKAKISQVERQIRAIEQDQRRLRDNLSSVPENSNLAKKYLDKMEDQEDKIEELQEEEADLQRKRDQLLNHFQDRLFSYNWKD
ncbi:MAG: hypothetical protein CMP22_02030 [Rickettsiales bacterium]|nr:hypothetical protein [Rickettsiales bacterium]